MVLWVGDGCRGPGPGPRVHGFSESVRGRMAAVSADSVSPPSFFKTLIPLVLARLPAGHCQALHVVFLTYLMEAGGAWLTLVWNMPVPRTRGRQLCFQNQRTESWGTGARSFEFCHCVDGGLSAAFTNIVFLFSLSLITSLTFPHLPCDNSRGG